MTRLSCRPPLLTSLLPSYPDGQALAWRKVSTCSQQGHSSLAVDAGSLGEARWNCSEPRRGAEGSSTPRLTPLSGYSDFVASIGIVSVSRSWCRDRVITGADGAAPARSRLCLFFSFFFFFEIPRRSRCRLSSTSMTYVHTRSSLPDKDVLISLRKTVVIYSSRKPANLEI